MEGRKGKKKKPVASRYACPHFARQRSFNNNRLTIFPVASSLSKLDDNKMEQQHRLNAITMKTTEVKEVRSMDE